MDKKYIVRLEDEERAELEQIVSKLSGSSQKVRRANILLQADANGPEWTDKQIAEAYRCRTKVERRQSKTFANDLLSEVFEKPSMEDVLRIHHVPSCLTVSRRLR